MISKPTRPASDNVYKDQILSFLVEDLYSYGHIVSLGPVLDAVLAPHHYPPAIARMLGEAVVLTILHGGNLLDAPRIQLTIRTDGIIKTLVVDLDTPDHVRAYAHFDAEALAQREAAQPLTQKDLLGKGHLAFTIFGKDGPPMQTIVGVEKGQTLPEVTRQYFIDAHFPPSFLSIAVAEHYSDQGEKWRGGGILINFLPPSITEYPDDGHHDDHEEEKPLSSTSPNRLVDEFMKEEDDHALFRAEEEDGLDELRALFGTIEDHELVDPTVSSEHLLHSVFHEHDIEVLTPVQLKALCRCQDEVVLSFVRQFTSEERVEMTGEDGLITVTCEFCMKERQFDPNHLEDY